MSERGSGNLSLDNDGWIALDSASTKVHGAIKETVQAMQSIVYEEAVVTLFERLGVFSAGFLFHDYLRNSTVFFKRGEDEEDEPASTYKTPYLWDDGQRHEEWSDCIHWLFVKVREDQWSLRRAGHHWVEDYFVNLPLGDGETRSMPKEQEWRAQFGVHYCSVGEMLFAAFAWRALSLAQDLGLSDHSLDEFHLELEQGVESVSPCRWCGTPVIQGGIEPRNLSHNERTLHEIWGLLIGPKKTWHREWKALLLSCKDAQRQRIHRAAVLKFIEEGGFANPVASIDTSDDEALNRIIQQRIPNYLARLNPTGEPVQTVIEAIQVLESYARFPILPFYAWNALNQHPICYGVIPIWTSQNHSFALPVGDCSHLGLALTGLRPIADWDWTLEGLEYTRASEEEPLVLTSLLRLMAKPLIEGNLYHYLWLDALERDVHEHLLAEMTRNAHEPPDDSSVARILETVRKEVVEAVRQVLGREGGDELLDKIRKSRRGDGYEQKRKLT